MSNEKCSQLAHELIDMIKSNTDKIKIGNFLKKNHLFNKEYLNSLINGAVAYRGSPLMVACELNKLDIVRLLVNSGADVNHQDMYKRTALIRLITLKPFYISGSDLDDRQEIVKLLIELMGSQINAKDATAKDALLYSIMFYDLNSLKFLIQHGADVNTSDEFGISALAYTNCLKNANLEMTKLLIEYKADVNARGDKGRTPLMYATSAEKSRILIENGANIDDQDEKGQTALMLNCANDNVAEELIKSGANLYLKDNRGKTALEHSAKNKNSFCTKYLTKHFLEPLFEFFYNSTSKMIRGNIQEFVNSKNKDNFPIEDYHILAIRLAVEISCEIQDKEVFQKNINSYYFLPYFISSDFQEKLWADVINRLEPDSVEVNGQTLTGRRIRAKRRDDFEFEEMVKLAKQLSDTQNLANEFYNSIVKLTPEILKLANKLFETKFENHLSDDYNTMVQEYLVNVSTN